MSNICDTQYKVRGSRKALSDLWNTLQMMEVNSKDVYLFHFYFFIQALTVNAHPVTHNQAKNKNLTCPNYTIFNHLIINKGFKQKGTAPDVYDGTAPFVQFAYRLTIYLTHPYIC